MSRTNSYGEYMTYQDYLNALEEEEEEQEEGASLWDSENPEEEIVYFPSEALNHFGKPSLVKYEKQKIEPKVINKGPVQGLEFEAFNVAYMTPEQIMGLGDKNWNQLYQSTPYEILRNKMTAMNIRNRTKHDLKEQKYKKPVDPEPIWLKQQRAFDYWKYIQKT